jgi:hypothetical protein
MHQKTKLLQQFQTIGNFTEKFIKNYDYLKVYFQRNLKVQ